MSKMSDPKNQERWRPYTTRSRQLSLRLAFAIVLFAVGWFVERSCETLARQWTSQMIAKAETRFGVPISLGGMDVSAGSITLREIALGAGHPVVIDRIELSVGFNPFSPLFLRPGIITIHNITVKEYVSRAERFEWLRNLTKSFSKHDVTQQGPEALNEHARFIPPEITVTAATITLADNQGEHTKFSGLEGTVYLAEKRLTFRAEHAVITPWLDENFVEGRFLLTTPDAFQFVIKARPKFHGAAIWTMACGGAIESQKLDCSVNATSLPISITRHLHSWLGSEFSPGFSGKVTVARIHPEQYQVGVNADILGAVVQHKALSIDKVGPIDFGLKMDTIVDLRTHRVHGEQITMAIPSSRGPDRTIGFDVKIDIQIPKDQEKTKGEIIVTMPPTSCDDALGTLPVGLAPELKDFRLGGTMSFMATANLGDPDKKLAMNLRRFDFQCQTTKLPETYTAAYLNRPFVLERTLRNQEIIHIPVDPSTPDYTSLDKIPSHVITAFVSAEDTGFWRHNGIEVSAIQQAVERNAREGRAAVGGSTITMQTAKNLFLSRDKTLGRKAQEMFIAWHLEREIGKKRILEIYLNVVEFGPGLYGIGAASRRFFGVSPDSLTLKQATYLASLLPAPIPRYQYYCRGAVTDNYRSIINQLLNRMLSLGRITAADYGNAEAEPLVFQNHDGDAACDIKYASKPQTKEEELAAPE